MSEVIHVPAAAREFRPSKHAGVEFAALRFDRESGAGAIFLRMAPGCRYPAHRHTGGEDVLVLEGELRVGEKKFGPGDYLWSGVDSVHAPWTERGCLLFASFPRAVVELEPKQD
jgi:anti-sigma factor ChrR (cupin superfamily)